MKLSVFTILCGLIPFKLIGQSIIMDLNNKNSLVSCRSNEFIVGINWHLKEPFICSDDIYFPYEVFSSFPKGYLDFRDLGNWMKYTGPYIFHYNNSSYFNDLIRLGLYHYVGQIKGRVNYYLLDDKQIGFYYLNSNDSIYGYLEYRQMKTECDSIFRNHFKMGLSQYHLSEKVWLQALSQYMDSAEVKTAIKNLDFEKFDNYYPIPISDAWRDTTYDYFKQVSKVFYLLLFKCKITYLEGAYIGFDLPNTNLDLNSDNAADRSFCKRVSIPYFPIVNIEDVEPYNPRIENK